MYVGVDINSADAVVVVIDGHGHLVGGIPQRVVPASLANPAARLAEYHERLVEHLRAASAEHLVLTDTDLRRAAPSAVRERTLLEAAFLLAAHTSGVAAHVVHQRAVASYLGLAANTDKRGIRAKVAAVLGDASALSPEPDRRARAIGAAWSIAKTPLSA